MDEIIKKINDFITEETRDLDNNTFRKVLEEVEMNISDQLTALELDECEDEEE